MEPYQARVIKEKNELREKTDALYTFLVSKAILDVPGQEAALLRYQHDAMEEYVSVLEARIALFK